MEELLESEAIEVPDAGEPAEEVSARPLPARPEPGQVSVWNGDVKSAVLAAAGGIVAGAATVAAVRATRSSGTRRRSSRSLRGRERPANVVASRSFLVDVHLLGPK